MTCFSSTHIFCYDSTNLLVFICVSVEDVKKKWQGLRDTFRKEFNKAVDHKSGEAGVDAGDSSWPYFDQMLFLKEVVAQRKVHGNVSPKKPLYSQEMDVSLESASHSNPALSVSQELSHSLEDNASAPLENVSDVLTASVSPTSIPQELFRGQRGNASKPSPSQGTSQLSKMLPPATSTGTKRKKQLDNNSEDPFVEIERQKIKLLSENAALRQNTDYQFLLSLLPFLMKIPNNRKLAVRNKLQQVLIDEEDRATRTPQLSPSSLTTPIPSPSSFGYASPLYAPQTNTYEMPVENQLPEMDSVHGYFSSFTERDKTMS